MPAYPGPYLQNLLCGCFVHPSGQSPKPLPVKSLEELSNKTREVIYLGAVGEIPGISVVSHLGFVKLE